MNPDKTKTKTKSNLTSSGSSGSSGSPSKNKTMRTSSGDSGYFTARESHVSKKKSSSQKKVAAAASLGRLFITPQSSERSEADFITRFLHSDVGLGSLSATNNLSYSNKNLVNSISWLIDTFKVLMGEADFRDSVLYHFTGARHQSVYIGDRLHGGVKITRAPLRKTLASFGKNISKIKRPIYFTLVDQAQIGDPSHYVGNVYNPKAPSIDGDGTEKVIYILDPAQGKNGKYPIFGEDAEEKYAEEVLPAAADQNSFLEMAAETGVSWELVPKAGAPQLRWYDTPGRSSVGDTFCQTWSMMLMIAFNEGIEPKIVKYTNLMKGKILSNFYKYIFRNIVLPREEYMNMFLMNYYLGKYSVTEEEAEEEIEASREEVMYLLHQLTPERFIQSQSWGKKV